MADATLTIGFLPLVDACLPILAHEHGFAADEGVALTFVRDVSWATVLDRLLYGHTDGAHMLAPLTIATTLGLGRPAQPLAAPFVLGLNGNAITLSKPLAAMVASPGEYGDPAAVGARLREAAMAAKAQGRRLRFGVVHRFSSHNYKLRYWLAACGIRPDHDVEIVTIAPPFVPDALASGEIDGSCVGEPWSSVCVERDVGTIVLASAQIWRRGVEKVLAVREPVPADKAEAFAALIRAMRRAGRHFIDPANFAENARILASPPYLDANPALVLRAISDRLVLAHGAAPVHLPDLMFQHSEAANFPWMSQAAWLYSQMARWGHTAFDPADAARAMRVFRPDIYRAALIDTGDDLPNASSKVEGSVTQMTQVGAQQGTLTLSANRFFDGLTFDPDQIEAYLASLP